MDNQQLPENVHISVSHLTPHWTEHPHWKRLPENPTCQDSQWWVWLRRLNNNKSNYPSSCRRQQGTLSMTTPCSMSPSLGSPAEFTQEMLLIQLAAQCAQAPISWWSLATTADSAESERSPHFHSQCQHFATIFHDQTTTYCFETAKVSLWVLTTRHCYL